MGPVAIVSSDARFGFVGSTSLTTSGVVSVDNSEQVRTMILKPTHVLLTSPPLPAVPVARVREISLALSPVVSIGMTAEACIEVDPSAAELIFTVQLPDVSAVPVPAMVQS